MSDDGLTSSSSRAASPTRACSTRCGACRATSSCPSRRAVEAYADRRAADRQRPDDLAAVHGRGNDRSAAARREQSACSRSAPVRLSGAVLAELAREVMTIERVPELAEAARARLAALGYINVDVMVGDGTMGVAGPRAVRRHPRRGRRAARARGAQGAAGARRRTAGHPVGPPTQQWLTLVMRDGDSLHRVASASAACSCRSSARWMAESA